MPQWVQILVTMLVAVGYMAWRDPQAVTALTGYRCTRIPDPLGNVTLHYFEGRGRAEAIRLLLEFARIQYKDVRYNDDDWPAAKQEGIKSGLLTFGQVPALETNTGAKLVQSQAILKYLARHTYLDCKPEEEYQCDLITMGSEDIRRRLTATIYDPKFTSAKRTAHLKDVTTIWFPFLENLLAKNKVKTRWINERITWVDFLMFDLLDAHVNYAATTLPDATPEHPAVPNLLASFPHLTEFYNSFKARPPIDAYLKSPRRPAYEPPTVAQ